MGLPKLKQSSAALTIVLSLITASFVVNPATTPTANATGFELRPGCKKHSYGAQRCKIYSTAMKKNISVVIRPSLTRNNPRVVQFLDGMNIVRNTNGWVLYGDALRRVRKTNATFVFGAGDSQTFYQDWSGRTKDGRKFKYQTFYTRELPKYLEKHFGVPNGGRGRTGVTGISAGAFGALSLASQNPKFYSSVYALSGFYDPTSPLERLVTDISTVSVPGVGKVPWASEADRAKASPMLNIRRLKMPVMISVATGIPNILGDWGEVPVQLITRGVPFEIFNFLLTTKFGAYAAALGMKNITIKYDLIGAHAWDTWRRAAWEHRNMYHFISKI